MLGQVLEDPFCVEHGGCMRGMGLLDTKTVFEKAKTRTQISGHAASISGPFHSISNMPVEGYEIHMGITKNLGSCQPVIWLEDGRLDAVANEDFTVFGSYLHGLFDQADFTAALLKSLMEEKGIRPGTVIDVYEYEQQQYDKLAGLLSSALDMEQIYKILEKGV